MRCPTNKQFIANQMPKYSDIVIDSNLFALAKEAVARRSRPYYSTSLIIWSGLPMPDDLQKALIEIPDQTDPENQNDRGFHENGLATENAQSVQEVLVSGAARSLEKPLIKRAADFAKSGRLVSEERRSRSIEPIRPYAKQGQIPPLELLGDLSSVRQGKEK